MNPSTIDLLPIEDKRVFLRVDFNVPLTAKGEVSDDTRIREMLPTLRYAREKGAKVILASHLGRPKGKADPAFSLKPVAERLGQLLRIPVLLFRRTNEKMESTRGTTKITMSAIVESHHRCPQ